MKNRVVITMIHVMALLSCASVAWAESGSILLGGVSFTPQIQVGESRNDNIFAQENPALTKSSWITTVSPTFAFSADNGANAYELSYRLEEGLYHSSHDDDYTDHFLGFNGQWGPSRKLNIDLDLNYNLRHDARGSTFTGSTNIISFRNPDKYHEAIVGASVDYGENAHVIVSSEYGTKRYDNNRSRTQTRDLDTTGATVEFDYPMTAKTSMAFEARYNKFDYKFFTPTINIDSSEQKYYAGLNWEATAKTSGKARFGYSKKKFSKSSVQSKGFFSWEVSAEWAPMTYSTWTLGTSSIPIETDGSGSFIKNTDANVSWEHAWSERVTHNIYVGYAKSEYQGSSARVDKTVTANVAVDYEWLRWLYVRPSYEYTKRSSNAANSSYKGNIWAVDIVGTL